MFGHSGVAWYSPGHDFPPHCAFYRMWVSWALPGAFGASFKASRSVFRHSRDALEQHVGALKVPGGVPKAILCRFGKPPSLPEANLPLKTRLFSLRCANLDSAVVRAQHIELTFMIWGELETEDRRPHTAPLLRGAAPVHMLAAQLLTVKDQVTSC